MQSRGRTVYITTFANDDRTVVKDTAELAISIKLLARPVHTDFTLNCRFASEFARAMICQSSTIPSVIALN